MTRNEAGIRQGIIFRLQHGWDAESLRGKYAEMAAYADARGYRNHAREIRAAMEEFSMREEA